jgi:Leucine-rich repeat (LRR) protein
MIHKAFSIDFYFLQNFRLFKLNLILLLIGGVKSNSRFEQTTELSALTGNASNQSILDCDVGTAKYQHLSEFSYCGVSKVDLTADAVDRKYIFNVTNNDINSIRAVSFLRCNQVEFIPKEVLQQFPSLNGLEFWWSTIPVLRSSFFTEEFVNIEHLYFQGNRITAIESEVFKFLTKLKWVDLGRNEIQQVNENIFNDNKQLEFVSFHGNSIESMNEKLFNDLTQLKFVDLRANECTDELFGCLEDERCFTSTSLLKTKLQLCSSNRTSEQDKSQLKCSFGKGYHYYRPDYQYCEVFHVDLSSRNQTFKLKLIGASEANEDIRVMTEIEFWMSGKVNFIPLEILGIPHLNGLSIRLSKMSTVKNDLFSEVWDRIEFVNLADNKIEKIESLAFQYLWRLIWINLSGNPIKSLSDQIFFHNFNLMFIGCAHGNVEMISPLLFETLKNLQVIDFRKNVCTNDYIKKANNFSIANTKVAFSYGNKKSIDDYVISPNYTISHIEMPVCYSNCAADQECAAKSKEDKKLTRKIINCITSSADFPFSPKDKFR